MSKFKRKKPAKAGIEITGVAICTGFNPLYAKPGNEPSEAENIAASANRLRTYLDEMESLGSKIKQAKEVYEIATKKARELGKELERIGKEADNALKAVQSYEVKMIELRRILNDQGIKI